MNVLDEQDVDLITRKRSILRRSMTMLVNKVFSIKENEDDVDELGLRRYSM